MVHEVAIVEYLGFDGTGGKRKRTIASGAVISKGQWLQLSDPNTAAAATGTAVPCAGIAAEAKLGNGEDYTTVISVYTDVVANALVSAAVIFGAPVVFDATDGFVRMATSAEYGGTASGAAIIGYAEETVADGERCRIRVRL